MTVKALMPVRVNLVVPLSHEDTAMRIRDTCGCRCDGPAQLPD